MCLLEKRQNKSGLISVQVIDTSGPSDRLVKTIGSSKDPEKAEILLQQARAFINQLSHQQQISFEYPEDETFLKSLRNGIKKILVIGPELILGRLFDQSGFNQIKDDLFRHLVISRLVFPLSKIKTSEYLKRYQNIIIDYSMNIKECLL